MIYDKLEKEDLLELLFKADNTIEAMRDRDEARDDLAKERAKLADAQRLLEASQDENRRLRGKIKDLQSLPGYHQLLEKVCTELRCCGSPTFDEAIADVKKRLGRL